MGRRGVLRATTPVTGVHRWPSRHNPPTCEPPSPARMRPAAGSGRTTRAPSSSGTCPTASHSHGGDALAPRLHRGSSLGHSPYLRSLALVWPRSCARMRADALIGHLPEKRQTGPEKNPAGKLRAHTRGPRLLLTSLKKGLPKTAKLYTKYPVSGKGLRREETSRSCAICLAAPSRFERAKN